MDSRTMVRLSGLIILFSLTGTAGAQTDDWAGHRRTWLENITTTPPLVTAISEKHVPLLTILDEIRCRRVPDEDADALRARKEQDILVLRERFPSDEAQGHIYRSLARMFHSGIQDPRKTLEYARRAMAYPHEPENACWVQIYLCGAYIQILRDDQAKLPDGFREEALRAFLGGLDYLGRILTHHEEQTDIPLHWTYSGPEDCEMTRQVREDIRRRSRMIFENNMLIFQKFFISDCLWACHNICGYAELAALAREVIRNRAMRDWALRRIRQELENGTPPLLRPGP
ncbi:MAG: hypothetical protein JXQ27_09970 [Acidobacteria bacterium]|nr:hypothetical protein [Acidobacteriota bacterium]